MTAGTYYMRAKAVSTSDRNSAWSGTVTFTVAPYAPTATPTTVYSPVKTVAVGLPKLTVTYPADTRMDYPRKYSAQVQFATDGAFTSEPAPDADWIAQSHLSASQDYSGVQRGQHCLLDAGSLVCAVPTGR